MDSTLDPVATMSDEDYWALLNANTLGRLALSVGGEVDIFPVNFHTDGKTILFRTAPGTKLLEIAVHNSVAFEIDGHTPERAWSVVVKRIAKPLESQDDIREADTSPLSPWVPTLKYRYVRIHPTMLSGRAFQRTEEPER